MNYFIFFMLGLIVTSCGWEHLFEDWSVTLESPIFRAYESEMYKKRGYYVANLGSSSPNNDVRYLIMSFNGMYETDIAEARGLYVELVEGLVSKINQNIRIRPYLHDYPATWKNTQVSLAFKDSRGSYVKEKYIAFVFIGKDTVYYNIFNREIDNYETVYQEPYEEALRIVLEEQLASKSQFTPL